jgi:hypothetical protein
MKYPMTRIKGVSMEMIVIKDSGRRKRVMRTPLTIFHYGNDDDDDEGNITLVINKHPYIPLTHYEGAAETIQIFLRDTIFSTILYFNM